MGLRSTRGRLALAGLGAGIILALGSAFPAPARSGEGDAAAQQFVYELNRVRWDPTLAGIPAATALPAPPLAFDGALADAAGRHVEEMAAHGYFAHQSPVTGLWPNEMARLAGYPLPPSWPDDANNIESLHQGHEDPAGALASLLASPGHRGHLLGAGGYFTHREIGVGVQGESRLWSIMTAHDGSGTLFLTGVVYRDADRNGRLDPGEGLAGVTITAGNAATASGAAGGWALAVPPGRYTVEASGGDLRSPAATTVRVGPYNVGVDFRSGSRRAVVHAFETCAGLRPTILGTAGPDQITGTPGGDVIHGLGGADTIDGGGGPDVICGGAGRDVLIGGGGLDRALGGPGTDSCSAETTAASCETP